MVVQIKSGKRENGKSFWDNLYRKRSMNNIFHYNSTEGAINGDLFIKSGIYIFLDATIIEEVFTNGQINIKDFSISNGVNFAHCLKIDATYKLLQSNYETSQFEVGPSPADNFELKDSYSSADK